jgi:hypothetical protein
MGISAPSSYSCDHMALSDMSSSQDYINSYVDGAKSTIAFMVLALIVILVAEVLAVHTFRTAGGVDLCRARLMILAREPKYKVLLTIAICYALAAFFNLIAFSVFADRSNNVLKNLVRSMVARVWTWLTISSRCPCYCRMPTLTSELRSSRDTLLALLSVFSISLLV